MVRVRLDLFIQASALQAPSPEAMRQRANGGGLSARQDHQVSASSPSKPLNIRPSMEARRRRLGLSALQVGTVVGQVDNLTCCRHCV